MDMIKTGDFLRSLRKAKGLTQEDVATRLMLSPKTISRWESGLGLPDINIISEVASLYDVSVDEILKGQRNNKVLKEETEKSNDKKINNILTNKITSKFNIYFYVAIGILSLFLVFAVSLGLLVSPIVAIILMIFGFIISIGLIIFGNTDIKMHYSSVENPNEINNAYLHSLKFIRTKNLIFSDMIFISFELNLLFIGILFNIYEYFLFSFISLFIVTISSYLIIRIFLNKKKINENKDEFLNKLNKIATIFSVFSIVFFIFINFKISYINDYGSIDSLTQYDSWVIFMLENFEFSNYLWKIIGVLIFILSIVVIILGASKKKYLLNSILTIVGCASSIISLIDFWTGNNSYFESICRFFFNVYLNPFGIIYLIVSVAIFIYLYVKQKRIRRA